MAEKQPHKPIIPYPVCKQREVMHLSLQKQEKRRKNEESSRPSVVEEI
jgi:hypothetical protein